MVLIFHTIQVLQVSAHLLGGFSHLGHLDMLELTKVEGEFDKLPILQSPATRRGTPGK